MLHPAKPETGVVERRSRQEVGLQQYRVFFFNEAGRVCGISAALFETDHDARQWARSLDDGRFMELWAPDHEVGVNGPVGENLIEACA
jgi:photosystem II stability/assembly factor-like uncharacterized protein